MHRSRSTRIARELLISHQVEELLGAFARAEITAILLKGTAFWGWLYGVGDRFVSDVDILVRERHMVAASDLLLTLGYRRKPIERRPHTADVHYNAAFCPQPGMNQVLVEIHRHLTHPARHSIDEDGLFVRAVAGAFGAVPCWRLSVEDSLLHLAIHRSTHGYGFEPDPRNVEDGRRIIAIGTVDWTVLEARAREWGCTVVLWLLLSEVERGGSEIVPRELISRIRPGWLRRRGLGSILTQHNGLNMFRWTRLPGLLRARALVYPLTQDDWWGCLKGIASYGNQRLRDYVQSRELP